MFVERDVFFGHAEVGQNAAPAAVLHLINKHRGRAPIPVGAQGRTLVDKTRLNHHRAAKGVPDVGEEDRPGSAAPVPDLHFQTGQITPLSHRSPQLQADALIG